MDRIDQFRPRHGAGADDLRDAVPRRPLPPAGGRHRLPHPPAAGLRADRAKRSRTTGSSRATSSSPDKYVVIEAEEIASLKPKATRQIEIEDFVDLADIDPVFFEQPYYLVPDKDNAKAYRLLADVMEDLGKVAIGRFVLRSKEALVAIRPVDGALVLETMRFADEVLAIDREQPLAEPATEPSEREKEMARQLVSSLTAEFDPEKYHDEYREELLALIDKKAAGEEIVAAPTTEEPAKVLDLMAALEASLARAGAKQAGGGSCEGREEVVGTHREAREACPRRRRRPPRR